MGKVLRGTLLRRTSELGYEDGMCLQDVVVLGCGIKNPNGANETKSSFEDAPLGWDIPSISITSYMLAVI